MRESIFAVTTAAIVLTLLITGCGRSNPATPPIEIAGDTANPFEAPQSEEFMPSSLGHGPAAPKLDAGGNRLPLKYSGGELTLDYTVKADGKAKNVGFLIFLDGIPQAYKIDTSDAPYEFMHTFNLKEDGREMPFSFIFNVMRIFPANAFFRKRFLCKIRQLVSNPLQASFSQHWAVDCRAKFHWRT